MNETQQLAQWAHGLQLDAVPAATLAQVRRLILDQIGCQVSSARLPWSQDVYRTTVALGSEGPCTVVGLGDRLRPDDAAFVNGSFGAGNEIDDAHTGVRMHAGAVVVPAVLAMAQATGRTSGADVLLAAVIGYEIGLRVAAAGHPLLMKGHHHTSVSCGPFGAAAASARLLGLDAGGIQHALAVAGAHAGGTMEYTESGGSVKRIYTGIGAQTGVRSALLAANGVTGPHAPLEGRRGFLESFADRTKPNALVDELGTRWQTDGVGLKNYFAEYRIHAPLQALEHLQTEHAIDFDDIAAMRVGTTTTTVEAVGTIVEPTDNLGAQFSMRYALAFAARHGAEGLHDIEPALLADADLISLARRTEVVVDDDLEAGDPQSFGGTLWITTRSGAQYRNEQVGPLGSPVNPMPDAQVEEKFARLAEPVLGKDRVQSIVSAVRDLESIDIESDLIPYLVKP